MKQFEIQAFGFENLRLEERQHPNPRADEVLIKVRAVSLNFRDLLMVQGMYDPRLKMPRVPVSDGAGEVAAVGSEVTQWKVGDRVTAPVMTAWLDGELGPHAVESALGGAADGMLREYATMKADALLAIPPHLSFEQAATLPCAAVTAWNGLFHSANLQPGKTVLIQGTGGVSLFGLQFAKMAGANVILTSSSDKKLERGRALGANYLINYKTLPEWEKKVLEITGGRGVDVTLEVGGTGTLAKTMKCTAYNGTISLIGVLAGIAGELQIGHLLHRALSVRGIYCGSRAMFAAMNDAIALHKLEPVVDRVYEFGESVQALRDFEKAQHFGKVVIRVT